MLLAFYLFTCYLTFLEKQCNRENIDAVIKIQTLQTERAKLKSKSQNSLALCQGASWLTLWTLIFSSIGWGTIMLIPLVCYKDKIRH